MARARKAGDTAYNARKRYARQAERYLKEARQGAAEDAARKMALAKTAFENALATYDPSQRQRISKPVMQLAREFGVNLDDSSIRKSSMTDNAERRAKVVAASKRFTVGAQKDPEQRRQFEAETLIKNPVISRRFFAATQSIWRDKAVKWDDKLKSWRVDNSKIYRVLFDYYGVDNLADLLDKVKADLGGELFDLDLGDDDVYVYMTAKGSYVYGSR